MCRVLEVEDAFYRCKEHIRRNMKIMYKFDCGWEGGGEGLKIQSYAVCASRLLIKHYCLISLLSLGCKTSKTWSLHLAW